MGICESSFTKPLLETPKQKQEDKTDCCVCDPFCCYEECGYNQCMFANCFSPPTFHNHGHDVNLGHHHGCCDSGGNGDGCDCDCDCNC